MPEPPTNPEPGVYQLRVVPRGVSPLIWRRLLVRSDSTIADLHASLQLVLRWSDEHLNRFVIHGREYGAWHDGGIQSYVINRRRSKSVAGEVIQSYRIKRALHTMRLAGLPR